MASFLNTINPFAAPPVEDTPRERLAAWVIKGLVAAAAATAVIMISGAALTTGVIAATLVGATIGIASRVFFSPPPPPDIPLKQQYANVAKEHSKEPAHAPELGTKWQDKVAKPPQASMEAAR